MDDKAKNIEKKKKIYEDTKHLSSSHPNPVGLEKIKGQYLKPDSLLVKINKFLMQYKIINKICIKLRIDPIYIIIALLIPIIILLFKYFTFTITLIALIYPLYMSFKTLQKKSFIVESEDVETTRWLSYWLIYAFINNTECIFWKFLEKIKIYNLIKFIFLILCFVPKVQLSVYIYNFITAKIFDKYGEKFEKNMVEFFRRIFGGKKTENNNINNANNGELIDDDFAKFKKNE